LFRKIIKNRYQKHQAIDDSSNNNKLAFVFDINGKLVTDDNGNPIRERRSGVDRRVNAEDRRMSIRWEPDKLPRRQIKDRRKPNLSWNRSNNRD